MCYRCDSSVSSSYSNVAGEDEDTIHDDDDDDDLAPENPLEQENETNLIGDHSVCTSFLN